MTFKLLRIYSDPPRIFWVTSSQAKDMRLRPRQWERTETAPSAEMPENSRLVNGLEWLVALNFRLPRKF